MESYRKKLKLQNLFYLIGALIALGLIVLVNVYLPQAGYVLPGAEARWRSFWNGFISGVSTAFVMLALLGLAKNRQALRNDEKLRAMYIKEHDERIMEIWKQSAANSYWFNTMGMLLAAVVAGYFSPIAFLCIVGCLIYTCIVRLILKVYYRKKL